MKISYEHFPTMFGHARRVRAWLATYCEGPDKTPVSIDDVIACIKEIYGIEIETRLVRFESTEINGFIEIWPDKAIIYLDADLNLARSRFVFVKEACHIMILTDQNATKDPADIIQYYVHERADLDARLHPDEVVCEEITKHGALDILYPPALRRRDKDRIARGEATLFTVAEELQLPEHLVEYVLLDYYMDTCERLRGETPDRER